MPDVPLGKSLSASKTMSIKDGNWSLKGYRGEEEEQTLNCGHKQAPECIIIYLDGKV